MPVNWAAYEDIADFFTNEVNGRSTAQKVYGHMDYGKKDPSLGWRFTDAWLSMAGNGDKGMPNGLPVDEWGIRVEGCNPVGSSVTRGGDTNGPASVYALTKYVDWLKKYAPPEAAGHELLRGGPGAGAGQRRPADLLVHRVHRRHDEAGAAGGQRATARRSGASRPARTAPYWKDGKKLGYQDAGSWTLLKNTPKERRKAAWLYAQFITSKTVVAEEVHRRADARSATPTSRATLHRARADKFGGLIEFYRARRASSGRRPAPTCRTTRSWRSSGGRTWPPPSPARPPPQQSMDNLAKQKDDILARLERRGHGGACAPKLNPEQDAQYWLDQPGAPARQARRRAGQAGDARL